MAAKASAAQGSLTAQQDAITDTQIKARGRIVRPTALLIDKSGSMSEAITVGRQLGAMISAICEHPVVAYAFATALAA